MAAILGLPDEKVVEILKTIEGGVVIAANFNCPGQLASRVMSTLSTALAKPSRKLVLSVLAPHSVVPSTHL